MEVLITILAAALLAAFVAYGATRRLPSSAVRTYLRGAVALLGGGLVAALLRLTGVVPAAWLFDAALLVLLCVVAVGFWLTLVMEGKEQRQLRLLRSAAMMLMPTTDFESMLEHVLDIAHAAVQVDGSSIMLLDPEKRELRFAAVRNIDHNAARGHRVSMDHPTIARIWSGEGPVLISDVTRVPGMSEVLVRREVRSFFAIPMVTQDTHIGFLNVHRTRVSSLNAEEVDLLTALASQAAVAINQSRLYVDLRHRYLDTVSALASAIEVNDPHTLGHSRRVAALSRVLAAELGLTQEAQEAIEVAALLHDIGKIGISNSILRKLGTLSPEERVEVRTHSMLGALVLREVETLREILPAVLHHHERWDGRGYPHGLRGDQIPLMARVVAVADAFEVMTAGRSYRKARRPEAAMAEMRREAGRQFDPRHVDALVRLWERGELRSLLAGDEEDRGGLDSAAAS